MCPVLATNSRASSSPLNQYDHGGGEIEGWVKAREYGLMLRDK